MAREAGAKKVYMASAAPPVKYPNVYGIDMPASHEFAADGRTESEICKLIGADRLFYQNLDDLIAAVKDTKSHVTKFDSSCFDGQYVTGDVTKQYLKELDDLRNDAAKNKDNNDAHDDVIHSASLQHGHQHVYRQSDGCKSRLVWRHLRAVHTQPVRKGNLSRAVEWTNIQSPKRVCRRSVCGGLSGPSSLVNAPAAPPCGRDPPRLVPRR